MVIQAADSCHQGAGGLPTTCGTNPHFIRKVEARVRRWALPKSHAATCSSYWEHVTQAFPTVPAIFLVRVVRSTFLSVHCAVQHRVGLKKRAGLQLGLLSGWHCSNRGWGAALQCGPAVSQPLPDAQQHSDPHHQQQQQQLGAPSRSTLSNFRLIINGCGREMGRWGTHAPSHYWKLTDGFPC